MSTHHYEQKVDEDVCVRDCYNRIANEFHKTRRNTWDWVYNFVNTFDDNDTLLDIGCGGGRNMKITVPEKTLNFYGIDTSETFIDICKDQGLNVKKCCMTNIDYSDGMFNGVVSVASYHHLSTVERRLACAKEMYRILKPGGRILLSVWSKEQPTQTKRVFHTFGDTFVTWKMRDKTTQSRYYYIFDVDEVKKIFYDCGFQSIEHIWNYGNDIFYIQK